MTEIAPFVSCEWLTENYADVLVCDTRAYLDDRDGLDAYISGHLHGSVFVDLETVFADPPAPIVGRHPVPAASDFADRLEQLGIGEDEIVVAYDDAGGMIAGRLVWMLRQLGQPAAVLDGGIDHYVAAGGQLERGPGEQRLPSVRSTRSWPQGCMADADEVVAIIEAGGHVFDSRGADRYRGEFEPMDDAAGHVPGAINLPFTDHLSEGKLRPLDEIATQLADVGTTADSVFYCGSGVSACLQILAAEAVGLGTPRLYVGSWSGWSSDPDRPVATGENPSAS